MVEDQEMEYVVLEIVSRIFDRHLKLIKSKEEIDNFLIKIIGFIKTSCFNKCSISFCNTVFSMTLNLINAKLKQNESKYLDICLLNDMADCLSNYIGKLNHLNQVKFTV